MHLNKKFIFLGNKVVDTDLARVSIKLIILFAQVY